MAVMDHRDHDGYCLWCYDRWPCDTALTRRELAAYLRKLPAASDEISGVDYTADSIDC